MPRKRSPPRLYLDRDVAIGLSETVRDRSAQASLNRTVASAEKRLAQYLGEKHKPQDGPDPLIADVLSAYALEHMQHKPTAKNAAYNIGSLAKFWSDQKIVRRVGDNMPILLPR